MQKHHIKTLLVIALLITPALVHGEETVNVQATTDINVSTENRTTPKPTPVDVRNQIRAAEKARMEAMQHSTPSEKPALRTGAPEIRKNLASTTQNIRMNTRIDIKNASSSQERWGIRKDAHQDIFKARQVAFVKQLELSIRNLEQISTRIAERITKVEAEGKNRDMTEAKRLLDVAKTKIATAKQAVQNVASYTPPTNDIATTTTNTGDINVSIDLVKPRQYGEAAIKAIKEAKDALHEVVRSLAKSMGLKLGQENHTATSTATTTNP